jgi:hypothetical protein
MGRNVGLMAQTEAQIEIPEEPQQQVQPQPPPQANKQYWIKSVSTEYLLNRLSRLQDDRLTIASIMVELADRAERNIFLQELLRKIKMPQPFDTFEYKRGNERRKGHWARRAYTRDFPTPAQLEARIRVAEISHELSGTKGNVERNNDTKIARINYIVGEKLRGKRFVSNAEKEEQKKLSRIVEMSGVLVQLIPYVPEVYCFEYSIVLAV